MNNLQYFIRFLKEYSILYTFFDAYIENRIMYEKNALYQNPIKVIEEHYEITKDFIARAFSWADTKQGYTFWCKINSKFIRWWDNIVKYERNTILYSIPKRA